MYFGQFFRKDPDYVCVHDTQLTPVLNCDNMESKGDLDLEQTSVNIKAIAQVCSCSTENVTSFLQKFRDFAFNFPKERKRTVCLNMSFGHMMIYPNSTIEFKSLDPNYSQIS